MRASSPLVRVKSCMIGSGVSEVSSRMNVLGDADCQLTEALRFDGVALGLATRFATAKVEEVSCLVRSC